MRNLIYGLLLALLLGASAIAESRPTTLNDLPKAARETIARHYPEATISHIEVERSMVGREWTIYFSDGGYIEFDRNGIWSEAESRRGVPATLLPKPIRHTIDERFEGVAVRQIERNRRGYEVELRNGLELKFSHSGKLLEVED